MDRPRYGGKVVRVTCRGQLGDAHCGWLVLTLCGDFRVTAPTERPRARWHTAALMYAVGALFVVLFAVDAVNRPCWAAAAAINFLAAADSLRQRYRLAGATA